MGRPNDREEEKFNSGIGTGKMIEYLNEMGYQMRKKPFVYTSKTLKMRKSDPQFHKKEVLYLSKS